MLAFSLSPVLPLCSSGPSYKKLKGSAEGERGLSGVSGLLLSMYFLAPFPWLIANLSRLSSCFLLAVESRKGKPIRSIWHPLGNLAG